MPIVVHEVKMNSERELAIDAADILNDFIGDLITGVMVFREYRGGGRGTSINK